MTRRKSRAGLTVPAKRLLAQLLRAGTLALGGLLALVCFLVLVYSVVAPPASATMVWRAFEGRGMDYRWVPIESMAVPVIHAVISSEDARYCKHNGVDWLALESVWKAVVEDRTDRPRGASTIAMQTVKNLFLWPWRSYVRKALEIPLAYVVDAVWSKRRLLEIYLNIAEWGPGVYGIEAAARRNFGRSARALSASQAALLVAILPNPIERSARKPSNAVRRKANVVRQRMRGASHYTQCVSKDRY